MPTTAGGPPEGQSTNRLIYEKSPYLLQHASNPVDWYPWGEEAFKKARAENKLVFLSVGYSSCHWCHVMEEESFADEQVAALMNETFISIKVDREERPDIDHIYMQVATMLTGSGGWPLTIIMTPDGKPFFAATYIPKEARFGRRGMLEIVPAVQGLWERSPEEVLDLSDRLINTLQTQASSSGGETMDAATLETAYQSLSEGFDSQKGGFGPAPKFPTPQRLTFLLRYWQRSGDKYALDMVEHTLQAMRKGGIYDHVGLGFHRYSTDAEWFAPHFEKMLYDQAMLAMAYTEAALATGKPEYENTAREILNYVLRDMTDPQGGFYSAEDADSEGLEGLFYLWTEEEMRALLPPDEAGFVIETFNMEPEGNFQGGGDLATNILYLTTPPEEIDARWAPIREALFEERAGRIHPFKDDKVLADWNGLMVAALSKAATAFDDPAYGSAARAAADFIIASMLDDDGRLLHRYRQGEVGIQSTLDDYAFVIWGLLELFEATFEIGYLQQTLAFQTHLDDHFWDQTNGGYFLTPDDGEELLTRPKAVYDGAIPSGNSVAMLNLLRLGRISGNMVYEERAAALGEVFARDAARYPSSHTQLLNALDFALGPVREIVIVGEQGAVDTQAMLEALRGIYLPNKVVLLRPPGENPPIAELAPFTGRQYSLEGKATAYVCTNYYCEKPTTDIEVMLKLLGGG